MVINFSTFLTDIDLVFKSENFISSEPDVFFDFAHTSYSKSNLTFTIPEKLDPDKKLYNVAIKNYLEAASKRSNYKLNNRNIRSYKFKKLPLFWITELSVKHSYYDLSLKVFFLAELLKEGKIKINSEEKVHVILPSRHYFYKYNIEKLFSNYNAEVVIHSVRPYQPTGLKEFMLGLYEKYNEALEIKNGIKIESSKFYTGTERNVNYIFTYFPQTWRKSLRADYVLEGVSLLSEKEGLPFRYLPFFVYPKDIPAWDFNWDKDFYNAFPSKFKVLEMVVSLGRVYKSLGMNNSENKVDNKLMINDKLLKYEIGYAMWEHSSILFNYTWYSNFFRSLKGKANVFYQDEFYSNGRLISSAIENSNNLKVCSIGVQHGLIFNNHTVYKISDEELNSSSVEEKDGMPCPDKFIVWSNYFKSIFQAQNSLSDEFVIPAGNLNHYWLNEKHNKIKKNISTEPIKILWCIGLLKTAIKEYDILKGYALSTDKGILVTIRPHPLHNIKLDLEKVIENRSSNLNFEWTDSKNNLIEDFASNHIVYSANSSGIILDALACNKFTVAVIADDYDLEEMNHSSLRYIKSEQKREDIISAFNFPEKSINSPNSFEGNVEDWIKILNEVNN